MQKTRTSKRIVGTLGVLSALVVVASPVFVAHADVDSSTIMARIQPVVSVTSADTVDFSITPTAGGVLTSDSDVVTVSTNNTTGYTLKISASDTSAILTSGGNTIPASANTYASPNTLANNTWGWAVPALGTFDATYTVETNAAASTKKWAGMPVLASAQTIKTTASTATSDATTVWYAAKANMAQPNGNYSDAVTYTATTNP